MLRRLLKSTEKKHDNIGQQKTQEVGMGGTRGRRVAAENSKGFKTSINK